MAKRETVKIGSARIDLSFFGVEVMDALKDLLVEELEPVAASMEARAKELCPVSSKEKNKPNTKRETILLPGQSNARSGGKQTRLRIPSASKRGYIYARDYQKTKARTTWKSHENRTPGRLRASVRASVHRRADGSAILLFLEAGNSEAYYAPYVELGTYKMSPKPFLRPAFNEYKQQAAQAMLKAVQRLERA